MAIIVGGRAQVAGPFLGAAIFVILPEVLRDVDQYRLITLGVILILVVQFAPDGLAGVAANSLKAIRKHLTRNLPNAGVAAEIAPAKPGNAP